MRWLGEKAGGERMRGQVGLFPDCPLFVSRFSSMAYGDATRVGFWLETENHAGRRLRDVRPAIGFQAGEIEIR